MKKFCSFLIMIATVSVACAQVVSSASFMKAKRTADVTVPYRVTDEGVETPIEWGLDLAWLSEDNVRTGSLYAGKELIDIVRTSYRPSASVSGGTLSQGQLDTIAIRANIIKKWLKSDITYNLNDDHGDPVCVAPWYNSASTSTNRAKRWSKVIDLSIKEYARLGITNLVSISPFNEPDLGWGQGSDDYETRKEDFKQIARDLKNNYPDYNNVRICGGNTLNDDRAYDWWNYMKTFLDEGNTHQLAGSFNNYANFFKQVRQYGHHATNDELHNTMEAMVGVEYGMQTGIWWGSCEYTRSQFMKATYHRNPGKRIAYGEHRNNWTAASIYRHTDGSMQLFGGTSERQAYDTRYCFVSTDRPTWTNGEMGRDFVLYLPGGTGYQKGQVNAEMVFNVQSGTDIMPEWPNGTYKIMNVQSGRLLGTDQVYNKEWHEVTLRGNSNTSNYLQWVVSATPRNLDFSYVTLRQNVSGGMMLDIKDWNYNAGAQVGVFPGGVGTNEQWYLEYAGEGAFYIRSRYSTKCLEVPTGATPVGTVVKMGNFTGGKNQQWRFIDKKTKPEIEAPAAPTALVSTAQPASVKLEWTASASTDVASYTVLRSEDGNEYYAIARGVNGTTFVDNEAIDGVEYSYCVYAVDKAYNYSVWSDAVKGMSTGTEAEIMSLTMNETLADKNEDGNHTAMYGLPVWVDGHDGKALSLDGDTSFVQLPYTIANHEEMTIAMWTKWNGGNMWQRMWDFGTGTNAYMFLTPNGDGGIRFAIKNGGNEQRVSSSSVLPDNRWVHVAVTIGNNGARLYVDGLLVSENTGITIRPCDIKPVLNYIGRSQFLADPLYNGLIDDVRIFNRALTSDQILAVANGTDGIENIEGKMMNKREFENNIYDLSGRKQSRLNKGINIFDGRKVLK